MRILFLSRWYPYPADNGSKIRIFNLLKEISQRHELSLICFYDPSEGEPDTTGLLRFCRTIHCVRWKGFQPDGWRAKLGFLSPKPRSVVDTYNIEMQARIEQTLVSSKFDAVIVSQIDMAAYTESIRDLPAILEEVEVGVLYSRYYLAKSIKDRIRNGLTWQKHRHYLASILERYRLCTAVSRQEAELISRTVASGIRIEVIPNCVDLQVYKEVRNEPQPNQLIFTGSFTYSPNYEAMLWFLGRVYPLIRRQVPGVEMIITGNHAGLPLPMADHVMMTGLVKDVRPYIVSSWCSVVPLLIGGGTRLKILEAMALCTPVVATSVGAEGLDVINGKHLLIADEPEEFAQAVIRILTNPDLRQTIAKAGFNLVQERYNWTVVMPRFLSLIDQVARTAG